MLWTLRASPDSTTRPRLEARALADEVVVDGRGREQRRHGGPLGADGAVGEDEDVDAGRERLVGLAAEAVERDVHPAGPSSTGHVMSSVRALKIAECTWRSCSSSESSRIGVCSTSWRACSGVSSKRFFSEPMLACRLITIASRIESIGGFVTCANSCLKYE